MAQETGVVNEQLEAVIELRLLTGATIECQVDTGFSGTVLLPEAFVKAHSLPIIGSEDIRTVSVKSEQALVALASVVWLEDEFDDYVASTITIEKIQG